MHVDLKEPYIYCYTKLQYSTLRSVIIVIMIIGSENNADHVQVKGRLFHSLIDL